MLAVSSDLPSLCLEAVGGRLCFPKVELTLTGGRAPRSYRCDVLRDRGARPPADSLR